MFLCYFAPPPPSPLDRLPCQCLYYQNEAVTILILCKDTSIKFRVPLVVSQSAGNSFPSRRLPSDITAAYIWI